jgi:hypothetical protein
VHGTVEVREVIREPCPNFRGYDDEDNYCCACDCPCEGVYKYKLCCAICGEELEEPGKIIDKHAGWEYHYPAGIPEWGGVYISENIPPKDFYNLEIQAKGLNAKGTVVCIGSKVEISEADGVKITVEFRGVDALNLINGVGINEESG